MEVKVRKSDLSDGLVDTFEYKRRTRRGICKYGVTTEIELKSLILAQIER